MRSSTGVRIERYRLAKPFQNPGPQLVGRYAALPMRWNTNRDYLRYEVNHFRNPVPFFLAARLFRGRPASSFRS